MTGTEEYRDICNVLFVDFIHFKFIQDIPEQSRFDFLAWL
jgi:hypothetical protein